MTTVTRYHLLLDFLREKYKRIIDLDGKMLPKFEAYLLDKGYTDTRKLVGRPRKYPIDELQVGDFAIISPAKNTTVSAAIANYHKRQQKDKRRFTTKKVDETTVLLRRVKDKE